MTTIRLASGKWQVELLPQTGGSIAACAYDGQDILRRTTPEGLASGEPREMASFPLVPFSNRIEHGVFEFDGRRIVLPPNMGDHPHPLHGQGWRAPWQVEAHSEDAAVLSYRHESDSWPWVYEARQEFSFTPDSLVLRLSLANLSDRPMPAGLGLHPYFSRTPGVTLTTGVTHLWEATNQQIPIRLVDLPAELDFSRGIAIDDVDLDHCFAGWNKTAVIAWPGRPYRLRMEGDEHLDHLVVYTPKGQDFFCVEGVENMNNAFNWMSRGARTGARILGPKGTPESRHSVVTTFRVERA